MKPEELDKARNPLLPAAWIAIRRAAKQAHQQALMTNTAIVVMSRGKMVRIAPNEVREPSGHYVSATPGEGDTGEQ
ncbi:hypothetical protein [Thiolapillus sp.]